ncbi:MAG: hypothetical protein QOH41_2436 [Blastocatellia bacterium]|jgi:hypothetical protein|nr:hypothetical protein [Blastocatellia bacterium]
MPLLQPPAEQPFSLIPPNWNPVSNDRVLLRLGLIISRLSSSNTLLMSVIHLRHPGQTGVVATDRDLLPRARPVRTTDFVTLTVTVFVESLLI